MITTPDYHIIAGRAMRRLRKAVTQPEQRDPPVRTRLQRRQGLEHIQVHTDIHKPGP